MLRLSELYLIAAATTNDDAVASSWLEKLRMIRGYQSGMVGSDVQTTLRQEWEKEFYGEGQYYYYLKCNGITSVSGPNGSKKPIILFHCLRVKLITDEIKKNGL
ncbi:MAG: hypothetical protein V8R91_15095 [Butyricimonas faecihominis]